MLHHVLYKCSEFYLIRSVILLYKTCSLKNFDRLNKEPGIPAALEIAKNIIWLVQYDESFCEENKDLFIKIINNQSVDKMKVINGIYSIRETFKHENITTPRALNNITSNLEEFDKTISLLLRNYNQSYWLTRICSCFQNRSTLDQVTITTIKTLYAEFQTQFKDKTDFSEPLVS